MQTRVVWGALWLGSVILAWFLGRFANPEVVRAPRSESAIKSGMGPGKGGGNRLPEPRGEVVRFGGDVPDAPAAPKPMDFEDLDSAQQFIDESVAIIDAHLRRGTAGHRALLEQLSEMSRHEERIELLLAQSEWDAKKVGYRWLRLLVEREAEVVSFVDAVLRAADETPEWFEGLDPRTLDFLVDIVGHLLPGMASEPDLARIRQRLVRVLKQVPGSYPRAIEDQREGLRMLEDAWAGPLGVEEARALLLNPNTDADEKFEILKRSPVAAATAVDLAAILVPALREQDEDDVIAQIDRFKLGARDLRLLDEAMLENVGNDESARWVIGPYLLATGRREWARKQIWLDEALRRGGAVRNGVLHGLRSVPEVDRAYVDRLLAIPDLTPSERRALQSLVDENER